MDTYQIDGEEVLEREVKQTGNGAHVYVPKGWTGQTVKVIRTTPESEAPEQCNFCREFSTECEEWCWIDESGGAIIQICAGCRDGLDRDTQGRCAVCGEEYSDAKSEGFGPMGSDKDRYNGCDECRSRVAFKQGDAIDHLKADPQ